MRAAFLIVSAALPLAAVSAAPAPRSAAPHAIPQAPRLSVASTRPCRDTGVTFAQDGKVATRPQKLGELPPGSLYLSVVRQVGGCPEPAIVRTGIGGR
jgi:hypothetical protein